MSGEKTLPILDAAHIRSYADGGAHEGANGLLLRTDIHKLFDLGYVSFDEDRKFVVSRRLKADFDNGKHYCDLHGTALSVPSIVSVAPAAAALEWHRQNRFLIPDAPERRYASRLVQQRLHQATFREAVLTAYGGRCALTGRPEPRLVDAAHIIVDRDEDFGQPVVPNGLLLSKIHHPAFDANLIGIDPDYNIHASEALLSNNDGPMFEHG